MPAQEWDEGLWGEQLLLASGCWDYAILQFDGSTLRIGGGTSYVHTTPLVLVKFLEVSFIDCPTCFHHARFSIAQPQDVAGLRRRVAIGENDKAFAIFAESSGQLEEQAFFVVAEGMLVTKTV
jgi:hypothetical protein